MSWFVVGISGVTCGGKTTLANRFFEYLNDANNKKTLHIQHNIQINKVRIIHQDKYFHPRDWPNHVWIEELNFINREHLAAIDTDAMCRDVEAILAENVIGPSAVVQGNDATDVIAPPPTSPIHLNILLIEGFLIYNDVRINALCHMKFFFRLSFDVCWDRRRKRVFKHINPNPERYFREVLWPSYKQHLDVMPDANKIIFLNGEHNPEEIFKLTLRYFVETVLSNAVRRNVSLQRS